MITRRTLFSLAAAGLIATILSSVPAQATEGIVVYAASSLKSALDQAAAAWKAETGKVATMSYAASSALAKQIESGAPAHVFLSADMDWMNVLARKNLVQQTTVVRLLGNKLVLVAAPGSQISVEIKQGFDLSSVVGKGRLAVGDVKSVPAGKYAKAALESLGAWDGVKDKLAMAENVRAALKLVATGEAPLGIVYATDAKAEPTVQVVATFPEDSHPAIIYPAAMTSQNADAAAFLSFLQGTKARDIFEREGFVALTPQPASN